MNKQTEVNYFKEVEIRLKQAGFSPQPMEEDAMPVEWGDSFRFRVPWGNNPLESVKRL